MPTVSQRSMPSRLELAATIEVMVEVVHDFTETFLLPLSGIKCIAKEITV